MKLETMGYRNLEGPQRRTETNEYIDIFRDLLLPGERWENLTWEEQRERIEAEENGTLEQLLAKKTEERERRAKQLRLENEIAMMEIERKLQEMREKVYRKNDIEQKVVNGEFAQTTDSNMTSIEERKTEQMTRETPSTELIVDKLTDLPIRNTNSSGTINGNVATVEKSNSQSLLSSKTIDNEKKKI